MQFFKHVAMGVFVSLWMATLAAAQDQASRHTNPSASSNSFRWSPTPINLCFYGNRDICETALATRGLRPDEAGIHRVKPERLEPLPPAYHAPKVQFLALSATVYAAAWIDMHRICSLRPVSERDPFARPLLNLPTPAYYAIGFSLATGINFLSWKLGQSRRFHRVWFLPQTFTIAGNVYGRLTTNVLPRQEARRLTESLGE